MDLALGISGVLGRGEALAEAAKRWGILCIGDSQIAGKAAVVAGFSYQSDPAFAFSATQPTTFVKLNRRVSESVTDPLTFAKTGDDIAVQPYVGVGSVVFGGASIGLGKVLTQLQIPAVITEFSLVGLELKQMIPSPSPAYPSSGGSWYTQMVTFQRGIETTYGVKTKIVLFSGGNNDGLNAPDSAAIPANMATTYAALIASFPGAVICWIKIPADTINFPIRADTFTNQATGFAALPNIHQIWVDDRPLNTDHAHLDGNGQYVFATRAFWQGFDALGYARPRTATAPVMIGDGPTTATDGTSAPTSDGAPTDKDLELLIKFDMLVGGAYSVNATPSGWTFHSSANQNTGSGVGCRMSLYTRPVDTTMLGANHNNTAATSVLLDTPCTRLFTKILSFRGSNPAAAPSIAQVVYGGTTGSSSSYTGPSLTTGGSNRRVLAITMGYIASTLTTTVTLTGLTGGQVDRNGMVVTPAGAGACIDVQETAVPAAATINLTNVATNHALTCPVTALIEIQN